MKTAKHFSVLLIHSILLAIESIRLGPQYPGFPMPMRGRFAGTTHLSLLAGRDYPVGVRDEFLVQLHPHQHEQYRWDYRGTPAQSSVVPEASRPRESSQEVDEAKLWGFMPKSLLPQDYSNDKHITLATGLDILQSAQKETVDHEPDAHASSAREMTEATRGLPQPPMTDSEESKIILKENEEKIGYASGPSGIHGEGTQETSPPEVKSKTDQQAAAGTSSQAPSKTPLKLTILAENQRDCPVCLTEYKAPHKNANGDWEFEVIMKPGECDHYFHRGCVQTWTNNYGKSTCPICRSKLS